MNVEFLSLDIHSIPMQIEIYFLARIQMKVSSTLLELLMAEISDIALNIWLLFASKANQTIILDGSLSYFKKSVYI